MADPKAISHILQKSGYLYVRPDILRERMALVTDHGILWVQGEPPIAVSSFFLPLSSANNPVGDVHKRQRRAMAPAFGFVEAKGLLPYFMDSVTKVRELCSYSIMKANSSPRRQMTDKWSGIIENGKPGHSAVIDVNMWFGKATLDAYVSIAVLCVRKPRTNGELTSQRIGAGAFEYDFGALDDTDNPLTKSYQNLMYVHRCLPPVIQGSRSTNHLPYSLGSHRSGTPLDYSVSSYPSLDGSQD